MYEKSGKLLKEANVLETAKIGDRFMPVKTEMVNKLRKNSRTVFEIKEVNLDANLSADMFTMRYLRR